MPIIDGKYKNPNWVNGGPPAINAVELNAISNTLEALDAGGGGGGGTSDKTPYIVVGTSANGHTANDCDYLCDGVADQVEINQALQESNEEGKIVLLLSGTYHIAGTITMPGFSSLRGTSANSVMLERENTTFDNLVSMGTNTTISDLSTTYRSPSQNAECVEIFFGNGAYIHSINIDASPGTALSNVLNVGHSSYGSCKLDSITTFSTRSEISCHIENIESSVNMSYIRNCSFDKSIALDYCGTQDWPGIYITNNATNGAIQLDTCCFCVVGLNVLPFGNITLAKSGSGSSVSCAANQITSNLFGTGSITLAENTEYNLVTSNGGYSYGTTQPWGGVTDNGSNNFVANNMPTT